MAASRSHTSRHAAPDDHAVAVHERRSDTKIAVASAVTLPSTTHLAGRVALATLLAGEAAADVDGHAVRRRTLQRRGERHRHPGRARHQRGDAEHLVERARQHAAVHAAGRTAVLRAERATRVHLDRCRRRPRRRLLGPDDPFDRRRLRVEPTRPGLGQALDPAVGVPTQEHRVGTLRGAEACGDVGEVGDGLRAHVGVDVGHHHRGGELAGRGDQVERGRGDGGRVGEGVAGELGTRAAETGCSFIWPTLHRTGSVRACRREPFAPSSTTSCSPRDHAGARVGSGAATCTTTA